MRRVQIAGSKFTVASRTSGTRMIVIHRTLSAHRRERRCQFSARIDVAEQYVCNRISHFDPKMPCLHDNRQMFRLPSKRQRTSVHQNRYDRFSRRQQFFQKFPLFSRQRNVRFRGRLSAHAAKLSDHCYDHVAVRARPADLFLIQFPLRSSARIISEVCTALFQPVQDRHTVFLFPAHRPCAADFFRICRKRSDKTDLPPSGKRQDPVFIF